MRNILFVSHFEHMKMGGQRSMTFLIENLDRSKYTPFAICPKPGELSERLESVGCKCYFVPLISMKPKNFKKFFGIRQMIKDIVIKHNIAVIHPDYPSDTYFCWRAKQGTKAKLIWHVRWTEKFTKDRLFERIVDGMIGVSDAAGDRFSKSPAIRAKYKTIYNGVDCEVFAPTDKTAVKAKLGIPTDKFMLLFVGILKEGKGVYDLADAMGHLAKMLPAEKMPLLYYVGSFPNDEKRAELTARVESNGVKDFVNFIPQQTNIHEWMQAAEALAIPSHEGNEGMPRVLYEAISCGTAGIGTDISGVNEAVTPETGLLVPEKNPVALANAVKSLVENPELLHELQVKGRERGLKFFDIRNHAKQVMDFYEYILAK